MTSPTTRWTSYLALPLILFFEALGWYLMRTGLVPYLMESSDGIEGMGETLRLTSYAGLAGLVLAGLLALPFGPALPMVAGAFALVLSFVALAVLPPESASAVLLLAGLGHALIRPALWAAASRAFGREHTNLRASLMVLLYVTANLAASLSAGISEVFVSDLPAQTGFVMAAVLEGVTLVLVIGFAIVFFQTRERKPPPAPPRRGLALGLGLGILAACGIALGTVLMGWNVALAPSSSLQDTGVLLSANTGAVIATGLLVAAILAGLQLTKLRVPPLLLVGLGMFGTAIVMTGFLLRDPTAPDVGGAIGLMLLLGTSEVLLMPMLFAALTGDLPWKLETAAIALYLLLSRLPGLVLIGADDPDALSRTVTSIGVALIVPLGIALVVAAFPLQRVFDPEHIEADEDGPTDVRPVAF